jgi:cysteinyl-tRNA synthetase
MSRLFSLFLVIAVAGLSIACSGEASNEIDAASPDVASIVVNSTPQGTHPPVQALEPTNWVYWLSDIKLSEIAAVSPDAVVIDYSQGGGEDTEFSRSDIDTLRSGMSGPALVISYMSIGEAEDYRYYWKSAWSSSKPSWLEKENHNWAGNYKVRYWEPEWQSLIFGTPDSYLDKIIATGFDGVYLDIIAAYDYFLEKGRTTAEDEMVMFVSAISEYAKSKRPGFLIFPQNAPELGARSDYIAVIDGIGIEGVYFGWEEPNKRTPASDTAWLEEQLAWIVDAGKTVLAVDYASSANDIADAYQSSRARGFVPTVTDVNLAQLPYPEK